ncbi:MAG: RNA polymerase sigma factor [Actinomycetota bacterium]|nr:RNA polymerase sigma factor [Actinomycetota bacterium]MDA8209989.1 RNA polymerase sigma factor [Actinomycetota bacterium]
MESATVKKLVEEAKTGSREAFDELVRITYPRLLKRAVSVTGNLEDARDAVQDAYVRAFRSLATFRGDSSFSQWMHTIVTNASATLAAKARRRRFELIINSRLGHRAHTEVEDARDRDPGLLVEIQRAVEQLPEQLRKVFVLKSYGLEHHEIAARLGISESNAKVRLHRARVMLRARLGSLGDGHPEAG